MLLEQLKNIIADNPLDIIEVYCPLETCRKRNAERGDRYENQSDEQDEIMSKSITYSCKVETHKNTPAECAEIIIQKLF